MSAGVEISGNGGDDGKSGDEGDDGGEELGDGGDDEVDVNCCGCSGVCCESGCCGDKLDRVGDDGREEFGDANIEMQEAGVDR